MESPPRRGVSTGNPAGLSSTIASASMKRMRSEEHRPSRHRRVCVLPRNETRESSALHNINLFPSDIEWLMRRFKAIKGAFTLWA